MIRIPNLVYCSNSSDASNWRFLIILSLQVIILSESFLLPLLEVHARRKIRIKSRSCHPSQRLHVVDKSFFSVSNDRIVNKSGEEDDILLRQYFATCIPGLHKILAEELLELGACNVEPSGVAGVHFTSSPKDPNSDEIGLKALLWSRTAHRIMELIVTTQDDDSYYTYEGMIRTKDDLYNFIKNKAPIKSLLGDGNGGLLTLSVTVTMNGRVPKELCHTHYTALTVKNALVDQVRELRDDGIRPDVNLEDADVPLVCVLRGTEANDGDDYNRKMSAARNGRVQGGLDVSLYRMLHSGGSLHRRGYRTLSELGDDGMGRNSIGGIIHKAALKESLAAGLLLESGWQLLIRAARVDGKPAILIDPMTGSATFPIEAAMIASDFAPGLMRMRCFDSANQRTNDRSRNPHQYPPAIRWKGANVARWKELVLDAKNRAVTGLQWMQTPNKYFLNHPNCLILGNEINDRASELAYANIENAGLVNVVKVRNGDCLSWTLSSSDVAEASGKTVIQGRTIVATNPPWGVRLTEDVETCWKRLKEFLQRECEGTEAWVLSGNKDVTKFLRMKKSRSLVLKTADEDLRWIQYHINVYVSKESQGLEAH